LKLKISNQQITIIEPLVLVADTENVYECEYVFDEEWEGFNKTAVFEGCGSTYQVVLTNTQKCKIPNEVIADSGYVRFGVLGTAVDGSLTVRYPTVWSERVWVDVASVGTGTPQPPTAEVYAQILANEGAIEDRLDEAEDDIEALDAGKVDKVEGKGLSTNDYSNVEKQKVADAYADKHTHSNKGILDAISQTLVDAWNGAVTWIATNGGNILSHLSNTTVHTTANEKSVWNAKQNHLTAGQNITIENDVISASGGGTSAVTSVNGQTGDVELDAEDVGALPSSTAIPTKTSDLTNDGDGTHAFLTEHQSLTNYYTKSETDTEISSHHDTTKADATSVYTKSEIDTTVSTLQPKTDILLSSLDEQNRVVQSILAVDAKTHSHTNKAVLDKIGSDANGLYWED